MMLHKKSLKKFLKYPYFKVIPLLSNDFFIVLDSTQPITVEDCLYYRDYTSLFIHKVIFFIKKRSLSVGLVKEYSNDMLVRVVNFKFFNRFVWFNKKLLLKKEVLCEYPFAKNSILKKNSLGNVYLINTPSLLKKNFLNNFSLELVNKPTFLKIKLQNSINSAILSNIDKNLSIKDNHWTHIERFETWTDSSNTSLTSVTSFESQYY